MTPADSIAHLLQPLDPHMDHVRGEPARHMIVEYGDYECPYSRAAYRAIQMVERRMPGAIAFAFRHFPLTDIHPHALGSAAAVEAAHLQGRFWEMHDELFRRQKALEESDLRRYAGELGLDVAAFDRERRGAVAAERVQRDIDSAVASRQVHGTPTLFLDGVLHRGGYEVESLLAAFADNSAD